eukprot:439961_1
MGSCFGRNRDQDDHQIENEDLLENGIDLESQEVIKHPTQSSPKHGSSSSLVPSKQIVLAVIGALLLLGVSIGGYVAHGVWSKKRNAQRRFFRHAFDTTGVPSDAIQGVIRGAHNTFNDLRSDVGADHVRGANTLINDVYSGVDNIRGDAHTLINDFSSDVDVGHSPQFAQNRQGKRRRRRRFDHNPLGATVVRRDMNRDPQPSSATMQKQRTSHLPRYRFPSTSTMGTDAVTAGFAAADAVFAANDDRFAANDDRFAANDDRFAANDDR